jgi:integrase
MSWASFRELYDAEVLAGQRPSTREKAHSVFDVLEHEVAPQRLVNLNGRTLSRLVVKLRERKQNSGKIGLEPITIRNYLVAIRAALVWATEQRMLSEVPHFPSIKVPKKRPQPVSEKEFELLCASAPDATWRAYFLCGWFGGLRLSEARHLRRQPGDRWPWLDLDGNRIVLPAAFAKSGEDQWVPLHQTLREALGNLTENGERVFNLVGPSGRLMSRHAITNKIARIARKARATVDAPAKEGIRLPRRRAAWPWECPGAAPAHAAQFNAGDDGLLRFNR